MMTPIEDIYNLFITYPRISTDSRNVLHDSLFFALNGEHYNGNQFAEDALKKGARFAIVDEPSFKTSDQILLVQNTLHALQELAMIHRNNCKAKIIAITGSNGKTTTKELTSKVLQSVFNTRVTKGNLNNHIGVPVTLLSLETSTELAVIEMGANHIGEIAELCRIAQPDAGLITNIGKAHLEGFGDYNGVIKAKSELYEYLRANNGLVFLNADNKLLQSLSSNIRSCTYGSGIGNFCRGSISNSLPFLAVDWSTLNYQGSIQTKLFGDYNFENVLAAVCIGLYYGISPKQIEDAISSYIPANNRSQVIKSTHNVIILDAYNANPSSMDVAIDNFTRMKSPSKMIILGDMMELGGYSLEEHKEIILKTRKLNFNKVIYIGKYFMEAAIDGKEIVFTNVEEAIDHFAAYPVQDMTILVKGSRKMMLEQLVSYL